MGLFKPNQGSARVACLSLFLMCAFGVVVAQGPSNAKDVETSNPMASTSGTDEGVRYKVPLVPVELQGANAAPAPGAGLQGNFLQRLGKFYKADWTGKLPSSPAPARRALHAPLDSTPFPSSDWGYGGSPAIGIPDGNVYPLMSALNKENSRSKVYGWVAGSVDASTSSNNNFPLSYDIFPHRVEMNQAVIY